MSSDRTPADVIAEAIDQWDTDMTQHIVAAGPDPGPVQDYVMRSLAAAGYRVVPIPDDTTRALAARLRAEVARYGPLGSFTPRLVADAAAAAALLDGQPEDRPAHCPECGSDAPERRIRPYTSPTTFGPPCSAAWHVGGSGDTR